LLRGEVDRPLDGDQVVEVVLLGAAGAAVATSNVASRAVRRSVRGIADLLCG